MLKSMQFWRGVNGMSITSQYYWVGFVAGVFVTSFVWATVAFSARFCAN
jgi:hypothetical protein